MATEHWQIEKKIPVALIASIATGFLVQALLTAWVGGGFANRIEVLEKRADAAAPQALVIAELKVKVDALAKLEPKVDALGQGVAEIKALLQRPPAAVR